ncbi:MAG TPA: hypothetical protein VMF32_03015 [Xanthobacteraceae bacterium]|nr:hypothetical protein [Xanthobacteraceae bacterium]
MARARRTVDSDLLRAAQFDQEYVDYWTNLFDEEDKALAPHFRRLMIKLWEYEKKHLVMHKTAACRLIPFQHSVSAKKYVDIVEQKGWITFVGDPDDKRKTIVRPSEKLLLLVEQHLLASAGKIKSAAAELDMVPASRLDTPIAV